MLEYAARRQAILEKLRGTIVSPVSLDKKKGKICLEK